LRQPAPRLRFLPRSNTESGIITVITRAITIIGKQFWMTLRSGRVVVHEKLARRYDFNFVL
jgi:hypothetical protein